eukprot:CAMPEP_0197074778 /NCGR_PEP_ID=MMETSP1384-20130603/211279_1 /TAXON_ID=29189 /ORGANISM="Ammonia sp." /LENGTH=841 /DNA_ID=CAMNT_0042513619 /DNA_START=75 /DNA_END=2600 /DNA_ORIENTATION=+
MAQLQTQSRHPFASSSLYVGDLAPDVTESTLFELFNAIGPVASIRVCRDAPTRRSLGYAYVNFHGAQDAERALETMNFTNIRGKQCRIMWSQRDPRLRQSGRGNIFVKNLHESIDNKTLYDTFSVFGNILSCKVVIDKQSGKSRGYGYVHYVDDKSARKAIIGVDGMTISDKQVHAELFQPRAERVKHFKYTNVYVKYIPRNWSKQLLQQLFEEATGGVIDHATLWRHQFGVSACLNFTRPDDAKVAVEKLNGKDTSSFNIDPKLLLSEQEIADGDHKPEQPEEEKEEEEEEKKDAETESKGKEEEQEQKKVTEADTESNTANTSEHDNKTDEAATSKLYVARAQKRKERKKYLQIQQEKGKKSRNKFNGANLYVKNLAESVDDKRLRDLFTGFGKITSAKIMRDDSGKSRGFGFVAFAKKEAATTAMHNMQNVLVDDNKPLYVARAQTKAMRQQYILKQLTRKSRTRFGNKKKNPMMSMSPYNPIPSQASLSNNSMNMGMNPHMNMGMNMGMNVPMNMSMHPQQQQQQQQQQAPQHPAFGQQQLGGRPFPYQPNAPSQTQPIYGPQNPAYNPNANLTAQMNLNANPNVSGNPNAPQSQLTQLQLQNLQAQQLAARQRVAQQLHAAGAAPSGLTNPNFAAAQLQAQQQLAAAGVQPSIHMNMPNRSHSMGQAQQSQPASSMQSGPQSSSIYRAGTGALTASQQIASSQPHQQSSVPTTQHSVSQLSASGAGQASAPMLEVNPLTAEMLQDAKPAEKKRLIGERLFPKIQVVEPRLAGKITGMLLEMDNTELLVLLSEQRALMNKINEALAVLKDHQQKASQQNPASNRNLSGQNPTGSQQN